MDFNIVYVAKCFLLLFFVHLQWLFDDEKSFDECSYLIDPFQFAGFVVAFFAESALLWYKMEMCCIVINLLHEQNTI